MVGDAGHTLEPLRFEQGRAMLLGGLRRHHAFTDCATGIPAQWKEFEALDALPGRRGETTYGVVCGTDGARLEYLCAVEVEALEALPAGMGRMRIAPQRYAVFLHEGPVAAIQSTWQRILGEWLPDSGYRSAQRPDFEVYDRRFDAATGLGGVEIWIAVVD